MKKHYDGRRFFNPENAFPHNFVSVLKWRLSRKNHAPWPKHKGYQCTPEKRVSDALQITYIGHATLLIQSDNLNILTDPMFSKQAGPLSLMGPKRVVPPGVSLRHLPHIDVIFVSHNHYDHLDRPSLRYLIKRDNPRIVTPIGNEKIIKHSTRIRGLDWGDLLPLNEKCSIQLLPAKHWSARTPFDRNKALWGSAAIYFEHQTVFFVGDSGFDSALYHQIRKMLRHTPDVVILPIGSYAPRWLMEYNHMNPEEAWEAFKILQGKYLIPTHHDVFQLGDEPYGEALERLKKAAGNGWNQTHPLKPGESMTAN